MFVLSALAHVPWWFGVAAAFLVIHRVSPGLLGRAGRWASRRLGSVVSE